MKASLVPQVCSSLSAFKQPLFVPSQKPDFLLPFTIYNLPFVSCSINVAMKLEQNIRLFYSLQHLLLRQPEAQLDDSSFLIVPWNSDSTCLKMHLKLEQHGIL